jgi:hypothetical protein
MLKEGGRLRVYENRVLKRMFGPKKYEVTGGWRKLHNDDVFHFRNHYIQTKKDKMGRTRSMHWRKPHNHFWQENIREGCP